jgi:ABC-type cobalamin/Fe3+-siderophores transport system ATPase subunit
MSHLAFDTFSAPKQETRASHQVIPIPSSDRAPVAKLERVSYALPARTILENLNLTIAAGEFLAVLGPNGAGKTTLLRLLALAIRPTSGRCEILGSDVATLRPREYVKLRRRIAFLAQRSIYNSLVPLTAREVIATGLLAGRRFLGWLSPRERECLHEAAERIEITALLDRPFRSLSGGEQQKVQIARALVQEPEVLLLDEPASGLDLTWQQRLMGLLESLRKERHFTVVMTTHHPHHLASVEARVALIYRGQLVYEGQPAGREFEFWRAQLFGDESSPGREPLAETKSWGSPWS